MIKNIYVLLVIIFLWNTACKKFLDGKPSSNLVIPKSMQDVDALLNNNTSMNTRFSSMVLSSTDEYYLTEQAYNSLASMYQNAYEWGDDLFNNSYPNDWSYLYDMVYISNISLETLGTIKPPDGQDSTWNRLKGEALFFRSFAFYDLLTSWASVYDSTTSEKDPGIPLRLSSDFNIPSSRQNVKQCYTQIIQDLISCTDLLPLYPAHKMKPSKVAAYGLLARVYLQMRQYSNALKYSGLFLRDFSTLLDYNKANSNITYPFQRFNDETVFFCSCPVINPVNRSSAKVDTLLLKEYESTDLRKSMFFIKNTDGSYGFRGSYSGTSSFFHGIATDEQIIIHAECNARLGNLTEANSDLDNLLKKRYVNGLYSTYTEKNEDKVLKHILSERRKELCFRNLRWADLKRLNKEDGTKNTIKRIIGSQEITLMPQDNRYNLPIPQDVVNITGMQQNPR